jgi:carboxyl-terminal processing protease
MNSKFLKIGMIGFVIILILSVVFSSGYLIGRSSYILNKPSFLDSSKPELVELFRPYFEAWDLVHEKFINQPVDDINLLRGSIRGLVKGLNDPNSSYMDPDEYRRFNAPIAGEYTGIGTVVNTIGDYLTIVSTILGSPAEKAGIKSGDVIIGIDSKDLTGIHPELVQKQLLGAQGTKITLTIARKGQSNPLIFELTRTVIVLSSIHSEMINGNIAYIQLIQYSVDADEEFRNAYEKLIHSDPIGLILDLRGNYGGLENTAIQITSEFINKGIALIEEYQDGSKKEYPILGNGIASQIPLVVLVNNGTASAAEITAGAIQDYQRGLLVGTNTYGKGTVQSWIPLQGDNGAVRITVARWLTPKGRLIDKNGLIPDYVIELTEDDIKTNRDLQKEKAIMLLENIYHSTLVP